MIALVSLYDYHSLAVRGLHSWLKSNGHDVKSLYFLYSTYTDRMYGQKDLNSVVRWLKDCSPEYIGVSLRSPLFPLYRQLSRMIRSEIPDCKLIVGGSHAIGAPSDCLKYADYVVLGEGELALLDILSGRSEPGIVDGIEFPDLDSLPFPYYGPDAYYYGNENKFHKISYNTSRGCFFSCSYCQECIRPVVRRRKSPETVVRDLMEYKRLFPNVSTVTFSDSVFAHDTDWISEFAGLLKPGVFQYWASGTAPFMTADMISTLQRVGFTEIRLGVQSGSRQLRERVFNRKDSLDDVYRAGWEMHRSGILVAYDFIIDNPYDTAETMRETRDYIRSLPPRSRINKFELRYWPGTKLTNRALADGVIQPDDVSGRVARVGSWSYYYILGEEDK